MEWVKASFKISKEIGQDELGNELPSQYEIKHYDVRLLSGTNDDVSVSDLDVTQQELRLLTLAPYSVCLKTEAITYKGQTYGIKGVLETMRDMTIVFTERYRYED